MVAPTVDTLVEQVTREFPEYDLNTLRRAYEIAEEAHRHQTRKTGEPYVTHCLATASILADLRMDPPVIMAGLLHDTVEDTSLTLEALREMFGDEVAKLVNGVTKLGQIADVSGQRKGELSHHQAESLRKLFLAMGDDVRIVLIKLADRLHNMRTLHGLRPEKQRRIAQETKEIYIPLANRMGIWTFKAELEDLCFRYLEPEMFYNLTRRLNERREEQETYLNNVTELLRRALEEAGIEAEIQGRTKHVSSIYRKMKRKERDLDQMFDMRAVRVIVDHKHQCYAALGVTHSLWRPIPQEFDDYIGSPKENNYQSLHTAVYGPGGKTIEVQIRDPRMHKLAEYGIAAYWRFRGELQHQKFLEEKVRFLRQMLEWRNEDEGSPDAEEFMDQLRSEVLPDRILVFTPRGDIKELPTGSTPIDFAYLIHTEVGHRCRGAKVNSVIVPLNYQLRNGDQVEVIKTKRAQPKREWLNPHLGYVNTQRARSRIRQWFRRQDPEVNRTRGRELLEREMKRLGLQDANLEELAALTKHKQVDEFLAAIGYGDISPQTITARALELKRKKEEETAAEPAPEPAAGTNGHAPAVQGEVYVKGVGDSHTQMGRCCNPIPGDDIIGYIRRGNHITIHRRSCSNVMSKADSERFIQVDWTSGDEKVYPVLIQVVAFDRDGLLRDIADIVAREEVNLCAATAVTDKKEHSATITATLEIHSAAQLSRILHLISGLPNVLEAYRQEN